MQLKDYLIGMLLINITLKRTCDKAILESGGTLKSVSDCSKSKVFENYPHVLEFVPEWFMNQKMCDKAVNMYPSAMCNKAVNRCFWYFILFLINTKPKKCLK